MAKSKTTTPIEFLRALYQNSPGGWVELRAIPTREAIGKKPTRVWTKSQSEIAEFSEKFGAKGSGYNVYFGVAKRAREGGKKEDVLSVPALWADIDTVANGQNTDKVLELVGQLPKNLTPSAIVRSGGGLHLYWFLTEPTDLYMGAKQIEDANAVMRDLVGGDNVCDITRVLRLPGTHNNKRKPEKLCEVVYCAHHLTYDLHDLVNEARASSSVLSGEQWKPRRFVNKVERDRAAQTDDEKFEGYVRAYSGKTKAVLDRIWRDKVRQHAPRGYMGIHEAIVLTTARLHCQGYKPEEIINKCVEWIKQVPDADTSNWDWAAERKKIEYALKMWGPKWKQIQKEQRANGKDISRKLVAKSGTTGPRSHSSGLRS